MTRPSNFLTATESIALVRDGKLTMEKLVKDHLARCHQRDEQVLAWVNLDEQRAIAEAKRLDAIPVDKRGSLHGVVLGVKDVMSGFGDEGSTADGQTPKVSSRPRLRLMVRHAHRAWLSSLAGESTQRRRNDRGCGTERRCADFWQDCEWLDKVFLTISANDRICQRICGSRHQESI